MAPQDPPPPRDWSVKDIRDLVESKFGKRPCWFQIKIALALRDGKDVAGVAATGAGKTLSFWIPLLMALEEGQDKMIVVVTPLNLLGKQTETQLNEAGLPCIAVSKLNNNPSTYKDIAAGKYRVVTISPELLSEQPCRNVIENPKVASKFLYFVFDEGHCISQWGHSFRSQYLYVGNLRYLLPPDVPFYVASATLPPHIFHDVVEILHLRPDKMETIFCSNDRPNIHLVVRGIVYPIASYHDLAFLIPDGFHIGSPRFPKFLIFFDSTTCSEDAIKYLRKRLPPELQDKIIWFHSTMTTPYREEEFERFRSDEVWGMAVTDAFGMGLDLPDVEIVVQYRVPGDLCTLWQRFGRSGRAAGSEATAILLVENTYFDKDRKKKLAAKLKSSAKRKAAKHGSVARPAKRPALSTTTNGGIHSTPTTRPLDDGDGELDSVLAENEVTTTIPDPPIFEKRSDEAKLASYNKPQSQLNVGSKKRTLEIGSALDDLINAATRGIECRRCVPNMYFGNNKALKNLHLECDKSTPQGCNRCAPKITQLCCDLCNPDAFSNVAHVVVPRATRGPNKSSFTPYEATENDKKLRAELMVWRDGHALHALGSMTFEEWGPELFMSDETLDTLVYCACIEKLSDVEAIQRETGWRKDYIAKFATGLLELIKRYTPSSTKPRGIRSCGACGQTGHNRANSRCPRKIAELSGMSFTTHAESENIPPSDSLPSIPTVAPSTIRTGGPSATIPANPYPRPSATPIPHNWLSPIIPRPSPHALHPYRLPLMSNAYATPERRLLPRPSPASYQSTPSSSMLPR